VCKPLVCHETVNTFRDVCICLRLVMICSVLQCLAACCSVRKLVASAMCVSLYVRLNVCMSLCTGHAGDCVRERRDTCKFVTCQLFEFV